MWNDDESAVDERLRRSFSAAESLSPPKSGCPQVATVPVREIRAMALAQRPALFRTSLGI